MTQDQRRTFVALEPGKPIECPLKPPPTASIQARALHRACLIVGGLDRLAVTLRRQPAEVQEWIRGDVEVPEDAFHTAVEIVLLYSAKHGEP